jgi:integrase
VRQRTVNEALGYRGLQATKSLKLIRSVCEYAIDCEYIQVNPTRAIPNPAPQKNPDGKRHKPLTNEELRQIWNEAPNFMDTRSVRMLQLGLLLAKRVSEIAGIKRHEVDLGAAALFIPGERTRNKSREDQVVQLPPLAAAILREAMGASDSKFVFPSRGKPNQSTPRWTTSHDFTLLRRALRMRDNVRLHDARSLVVPHLAMMGVPSEYRSHVLSHTGDVRSSLESSTYNEHDYLPEKRRALEMWERRLLAIVQGQELPSKRW